jgi:hypothetical protein
MQPHMPTKSVSIKQEYFLQSALVQGFAEKRKAFSGMCNTLGCAVKRTFRRSKTPELKLDLLYQLLYLFHEF